MSEQFPVVNTSIDTYGLFFTKYNNIVLFCNTDVVTVNTSCGITTGNGFVIGSFGANVIACSNLQGGNTSVTTPINILSNTILSSSQVNCSANLNITGANTNINTTAIVGVLTVSNNVTITGNLAVNNQITINSGAANAAFTLNSTGLNQDNINFQNTGVVKWQVGKDIDDSFFIYDSVAAVKRITISNTSGNITLNANAVLYGTTTINSTAVSTGILSGNINASNVTSGTLLGTILNGTYANVTGIGTLTNLNVSATANIVTLNTTTANVNNLNANTILVASNSQFNGWVTIGQTLSVIGNLNVSGNLIYSGTSSGNVIAVSNGYALGSPTVTWSLYAANASFSNAVNMLSTLTVSDTVNASANVNITGSANVTGNVNCTGSINTQGGISSNGTITYGSNGDVQERQLTVKTYGTGLATLDSYPAASYRTSKYLIQVDDNNANNHYSSEILITHDGSNAYIVEYGSITTNTNVGQFATVVASGVVQLNYTPISSNTTVKLVRLLLTQ